MCNINIVKDCVCLYVNKVEENIISDEWVKICCW